MSADYWNDTAREAAQERAERIAEELEWGIEPSPHRVSIIPCAAPDCRRAIAIPWETPIAEVGDIYEAAGWSFADSGPRCWRCSA